MRRVIRHFALAACFALTAASLFAATGSFDRTLRVTGPVDLEVSTGSGSISVRTGEAGVVRVHATIRSGFELFGGDPEAKVRRIEANPPIEQNGNIIRIGRIDDPELRRNISISYEVVVPVETRLNAKSGSGDVTIDGVRGPAEISTGSGHLQIANIGADVRASTGSGDIDLAGVNGALRASTGSGHIQGQRIAGAVDASTGSGDVNVQQTAPGNVRVQTGSGDVEVGNARGAVTVGTGSGDVRAQGEPVGDWHVETGSGSVRIQFPSGAGFQLDAHTGSGSINADQLPITIQGSTSRRQLRGKVRDGGHLVTLRTSSGDITVR